MVGGRLTIPGAEVVGLREVRAVSDDAGAERGRCSGRPRSTCSAPTSPTSRRAIRNASSRWGASPPTTSRRRSRPAPSGGGRWRWRRWRCWRSSGCSSIGPPGAACDGHSAAGQSRSAAARDDPPVRASPTRSGCGWPCRCWRSSSSAGVGASRTLPAGRRIASLVIRLVLVACLVLSLAGRAWRCRRIG